MTFELWDMGSGNMLDEFETCEDAVRSVAELLEDGGSLFVNRLALFGPDMTGQQRRLADGVSILDPVPVPVTP